MKRGFKADANRIAVSIREELEITVMDELDCVQFAELLGIPVLEFTKFKTEMEPDYWNQLATIDSSAFSAMTLFKGHSRVVILNNRHHPNRQKSSLAHEFAHALLLHPPLPVHSLQGKNHRNSEHEQEAAYLAGALLVPNEACIQTLRDSLTAEVAAKQFGVSTDLMKYRLRISGSMYRYMRERSRRLN